MYRTEWPIRRIQNDDAGTAAIRATQIQPIVRCGSVPFGAANRTRPGANAAMPVKAYAAAGWQERPQAAAQASCGLAPVDGRVMYRLYPPIGKKLPPCAGTATFRAKRQRQN